MGLMLAWRTGMQVFQTHNEICVFHGYLSNLDDLLDTLTKSGRSKRGLGNPAGVACNGNLLVCNAAVLAAGNHGESSGDFSSACADSQCSQTA